MSSCSVLQYVGQENENVLLASQDRIREIAYMAENHAESGSNGKGDPGFGKVNGQLSHSSTVLLACNLHAIPCSLCFHFINKINMDSLPYLLNSPPHMYCRVSVPLPPILILLSIII